MDSCVQFNVNLTINHPYSDSITYLYYDCAKKQGYRQRVALKNGAFKLTGTVNRSDEVIFICNPSSLFEDSSYYRLIVGEGTTSVQLTMKGPAIIADKTTGSKAQSEMRLWKEQHRVVLQKDEKYAGMYRRFLRSSDPADTVDLQKRKLEFQTRLNLLSEVRAAIALDYIRQHPNSYFSGSLLSRYKRLCHADTVMVYFHRLTPGVQQSAFGKQILDDAFARSDNWELFSNYLDSTTYEKVKTIRSVYDLSLPSVKGDTISLSNYKGKIILLDFWASWCGPCITNIPALNRLMDEVKEWPVVVLSVSVDVNENNWRNAIQKYNYKGVQLLDRSSLLAAYYKVLGYPTYILIDQNGKLIEGNAPGPEDGNTLRGKIKLAVGKINPSQDGR